MIGTSFRVLFSAAARTFAGAILLMGGLRFALTMAGVPNSTTRFASMTAVIFAGTSYFAWTTTGWRERLQAAYALLIPYMLVEVGALGYTWLSGVPTIFHAQEYSFGVRVASHFWGHLIGGLTWEPLSVFILMTLIAWGRGAILRAIR